MVSIMWPYLALPLQHGRKKGLTSATLKIKSYTRLHPYVSSCIKTSWQGQHKKDPIFLKNETKFHKIKSSQKMGLSIRPKLSCMFMLQTLHMLTGKRYDKKSGNPSEHRFLVYVKVSIITHRLKNKKFILISKA